MSIEQAKLVSMPLNNKQTKAIYKGKKNKTTLFHIRFLNSIYKTKDQERRVSRDSGQESTARLLSTQPGFFFNSQDFGKQFKIYKHIWNIATTIFS